MNELIKKVMDAGKPEALDSLEALLAAAQELGLSPEEVASAMEDFDGSLLDEDELMQVAGGFGTKPTMPPAARKDAYL